MVYYNIITILNLAQAFVLLYIITTQQNPLLTCLNILNVQRINVTFNRVIIQEKLA